MDTGSSPPQAPGTGSAPGLSPLHTSLIWAWGTVAVWLVSAMLYLALPPHYDQFTLSYMG
jgi:hypothetical protein